MHTLYGNSISGNCWKPAVMLHVRGLPFRWIEVDILKGESRTAEFLKLNPNGRVPLLVLPDGRMLAESNAMLLHLGEGTPWLPSDPYLRAKTYEWLFFEQYSHEPHIAVARFWITILGQEDRYREQIARRHELGYLALDAMERYLAGRSFFVGERYSIADIGLYAYTHVADEGGFDLAGYPAIGAWLGRVAAQPGHVTIDDS
jgi:glutathione S-transferase